ncbi:MAG TPA: N-acetylglucosamine-6-phosphate deacetylase [Thermoanaerobaculia bacterium]|nr:N-acetylglucosamine-6-phosphate deacetylase [Thermoanaerobaculia bacterium]
MNGEKRIHGRAFVDGTIKDDILLTIRGSEIVDVMQIAVPPASADRVRGLMVPGFIDVHVHGGDGADFTDGDGDANERIINFHAKNGTTALAPTTLSASKSDLHRAAAAISRTAANAPSGAEICGIHLEGPFINARSAGAQDVSSIRPSDIQELSDLIATGPRLRWMMTLAPEIDGARALIEHFRGRVLFSIGHTGAMFADAVAALEWGASHFTHLFNAMTGMHHREPGVVGAALESVDATAELIADGIHVHPAVLRIACTAMPGRIVLVTDAIRAAGMPEGKYKLYDYDVTVTEGSARLPNGTLAGSVLTMNAAVQNMVELAGLPIERVLPMATEIPARILNVADRKGRLENSYDADIVVLTEKFEIERVFTRGAEVAR